MTYIYIDEYNQAGGKTVYAKLYNELSDTVERLQESHNSRYDLYCFAKIQAQMSREIHHKNGDVSRVLKTTDLHEYLCKMIKHTFTMQNMYSDDLNTLKTVEEYNVHCEVFYHYVKQEETWKYIQDIVIKAEGEVK